MPDQENDTRRQRGHADPASNRSFDETCMPLIAQRDTLYLVRRSIGSPAKAARIREQPTAHAKPDGPEPGDRPAQRITVPGLTVNYRGRARGRKRGVRGRCG